MAAPRSGRSRSIAGFVADLPVPGHENHPATAFKDTPADARALPWFFDRASAEEAQSVARINWSAESQLPAYVDGHGHVFPFLFNGITWMDLNHLKTGHRARRPEPTDDAGDGGGRHHLHGEGHAARQAAGQFQKRGRTARAHAGRTDDGMDVRLRRTARGNRFPPGAGSHVALADLCGPPAAGQRHRARRRPTRNRSAATPTPKARRKRSFSRPLGDVKAGTVAVPLSATADSGLPVSYFVVVGPAVVKDGKLVFTGIPPRAKLPITVTVAAWQWGRYAEPKISRAEIIRQSFAITPP